MGGLLESSVNMGSGKWPFLRPVVGAPSFQNTQGDSGFGLGIEACGEYPDRVVWGCSFRSAFCYFANVGLPALVVMSRRQNTSGKLLAAC